MKIKFATHSEHAQNLQVKMILKYKSKLTTD